MTDDLGIVAPAGRALETAGVDRAAPSFSVIVAAYQVEDVVGPALDSALGQTYPATEIIVCDDGSTDRTWDVLQRYGDRVRLIRQANRGEPAAKNAAARQATGDFLVILDADDEFAPERLEALARLAVSRPDLDILTTDAWLELDGVRVRHCYNDAHRFEVADQPAEILRRNFVFGLAAIRRSRFEAVGGFDEAISRTCDWDLWIRMIHTGCRVGMVDAPLATYRVRRESLSADRVGMALGGLTTLLKAGSMPDLSDGERRALAQGLRREHAKAVEREARRALLTGAADTRRRLLTVTAARGVPPGRRAKALLAAVAPGLTRRRLLQGSAGWSGAGGVTGAR